MKPNTLRALPLLALFLLTALPVQHAVAQAPVTPDVVAETPSEGQLYWAEHLDEQIEQLLQEPDAVRQNKAMVLILSYSHADAALPVDFRSAVPRLLEIYESDAEDSRRLLALAALNAIDEPYALRRMAERAPLETSPQVYRQTLHVLAARQN